MTAEQIRALFALDAVEIQRAFVLACPASYFRDHVIDMVGPIPRDRNLRILTMLSDDYCRSGETALASAIGQAVFALARSFYQEDPANTKILEAGGNAAAAASRALRASGRHDQVIEFASETIEWLTSHGRHPKTAPLLLDLADAHRQRKQFDAARAALNRAEPLLEPDQAFDRERLEYLRDQIERLVGRSVTDLPPKPQSEADLLKELNPYVKAAKSSLPKNPLPAGPAKKLKEAISKLPEQAPVTPQEWLATWAPHMDEQSKIVAGGAGGEMNLARNRWRKRKANEILFDEKQGHDPERLAQARALYLDAESWARDNGYIDDANAALWGLYLCHFRTGKRNDAISNLQAIWRSLEQIRVAAPDPSKRAGVFSEFPRLFPLLCRSLCEAGRFEEMLASAEAAKGRAIEDALSTNGTECFVSSQDIAERVRKALARLDTHYVSFIVDKDASYAVLVTGRGEFHGHAIPIGRAELRKYAGWVDPRRWGSRPDGRWGEQVPENVNDRLAPVVAWIAPYLADGTIRRGDHICYTPHGELFLAPIHALPVADGLLIDYCSVSRLHHASVLERLAERKAIRPKRYCSVFVPAVQDLADEKKLADLRRPIDWLASRRKGRQVAGSQADVEKIGHGDLSARVVHFAAHGVFPNDENPFEHSGILLPHGGEAPTRGNFSKAQLLSPARVMGLDFNGSHVTLQACVSGLMREGVGGDALGLEWALMLRGADSILSTHWNVWAKDSAAFCVRFYEHWLAAGESRAAAWRRSCLALKKHGGWHWSSFSLSGDWR